MLTLIYSIEEQPDPFAFDYGLDFGGGAGGDMDFGAMDYGLDFGGGGGDDFNYGLDDPSGGEPDAKRQKL